MQIHDGKPCCWHAAGEAADSEFAGSVEACCWCGERRSLPARILSDLPQGHGPHLPGRPMYLGAEGIA